MRTELQEKLLQAARLLIEIRALCDANGKAYREQFPQNLALARGFENLAGRLQSNTPVGIESLGDFAEMRTPLLTTEIDQVAHEKELALTFRRNPAGYLDTLNEEFGKDLLEPFRMKR